MNITEFPTSQPTFSPTSFCVAPQYSKDVPSCDNSLDVLKAIFIYPGIAMAIGLPVVIGILFYNMKKTQQEKEMMKYKAPALTAVFSLVGIGGFFGVLFNGNYSISEKSCNHIASSKNYETAAFIDLAIIAISAVLILYHLGCIEKSRLNAGFFGIHKNNKALNQKLLDPEAANSSNNSL